MLPVLLSEGYHKGKISLERIAEVTSYNVARIFNMPEKGKLQPGTDADLVIVDLDKEKVVNAADLKSYSDFSVFEGWNLKGWPVMTLVRGSIGRQRRRDRRRTPRPVSQAQRVSERLKFQTKNI